MGGVCKAKDADLDRHVAPKFLLDDVAKEPQALSCLRRETPLRQKDGTIR